MDSNKAGDGTLSVQPSPTTPASSSWIQKTPGVVGGDACVRKTRITVWGLVEWRHLGLSDAEILARVPGLTPADLEAAWEYYEHNRDEIEQAIRDNAEA
jgi:type III restriction enzyme